MPVRICLSPWQDCCRTIALLAIVGAVTAASVSVADDSPTDYFPRAATPAERLLPSTTVAFATVPSAARFRTRWDRSSFGQMAADPAFGPFLDDVRSRLTTLSWTLGFDAQTLWTATDGELAVAAVRTDAGRFALVAVANVADDAAADRLLDRLTARLTAAGSEAASLEAGDRTFTSWTNARDRSRTLAYYRDAGHIVFSDRMATLLDIAAREPSESSAASASSSAAVTPSLAELPSYQSVRRQTQTAAGDASIRWYANPLLLVRTTISNEIGPAEAAAAGSPAAVIEGLLAASGLGQLEGIGGLFDLPGGEIDSLTSTFGHLEGEPRGLVRALAMPASVQQPPRWVKDDVSLYSQMNWSPQRLLEVVREAVDATRGPGTFETSIASQPVAGDLTVAELAAVLDGPIHVAAEVPQSASDLTRQATVFAIETAKGDEAERLLQQLAEAGGLESREVAGHRVYAMELTVPVPEGSPLQAVRTPELAVTVAEGAILLSTSGAYLDRTLGRLDSARPLAESPQYREIASQFPRETSVINYQRQDARFAGLYEELRSGSLRAAGSVGLVASLAGFDFTKLPPFPAMSRYLQTTGGFAVPVEGGFRIVNFALSPREQ